MDNRINSIKWLEHPSSSDFLYTLDFEINGWYLLKMVGGPVIGVVNQHESRELSLHERSIVHKFMLSLLRSTA